MSEAFGADSLGTISRETAEHYTWSETLGVPCDGWHLVRTPELSVIEERMPPGAREVRHYHVRARQFFYVLGGELTIEVEGRDVVLRCGEGVEIAPGQRHQVMNRGEADARMLVVSQPRSHGDRVVE